MGRLKCFIPLFILLFTSSGFTAYVDTVSVDNFPVTQAVSQSGTWNINSILNPIAISGTVPVSGPLTDVQLRASPVPVSGTFFQATQPVSIAGTVAVSGPLTDSQLRATAVPISGTVTANTGLSQPLTDAQLRSSEVPVSLTSTTITGSVSVTGPLTDSQLRASAVPISAAALPLPSGAATSALQTTGNTFLSSIDTKTPALGQALAADSVPVVLTAAQLSTLTPLSTVSARLQDGAGNQIASVSDGNGGRAIEVAQSATSFIFSTVNSTTVQLAAGATFNGAVETVTNQQSASILLTTDQPGTLNLIEYIDAGGTRVSRAVTYSIAANIPFSRSFVLNGNYFRANFTNTGASTTTTLNLNTAYGTIPSATALGNGQVSLDEVNGTAISLGRKTAALSLPVVEASEAATYSSAIGNLTMVNTPTDVFTITGSATRTVRIRRITVGGSQNTAAMRDVFLVKRSTANSGGTSTTPAVVPHDSTNAAGTAVVRAYTANPTLGTLVGNVRSRAWPLLGNASANNGQFGPDNTIIFDFDNEQSQPITLRGTGEVLSVNFNSVTSAGNSMHFLIEWTEE